MPTGQTRPFVVYLFGPSPEGKYYVGQSMDFRRRVVAHKQAKGECPRIHTAIQQFGWENIPLQIIAEADFQEAADQIETLNIIKYDSIWPNGYNLAPGGRLTRPDSYSFDAHRKVPGFDESPVSREELLGEAKRRLQADDVYCPVCDASVEHTNPGYVMRILGPCYRCGVTVNFGKIVLTHFVSGKALEEFTFPPTKGAMDSFRQCREASWFVRITKSRTDAKLLSDLVPVAALQYAGRLIPYLRASMERGVRITRGERSALLGRFVSLVDKKSDLDLEIKVRRHLRKNRRILGASSADNVSLFRESLIWFSGKDGALRSKVETILTECGAPKEDLAAAIESLRPEEDK